ncbi:MAG: hypothetical protein ABJB17_05915 [Burkholderiales bacterium]
MPVTPEVQAAVDDQVNRFVLGLLSEACKAMRSVRGWTVHSHLASRRSQARRR